MDVHPNAKLRSLRGKAAATRIDPTVTEREATMLQLRTRLLKLIKEQEQSRVRSTPNVPKPR
jgi:hypothetical protein